MSAGDRMFTFRIGTVFLLEYELTVFDPHDDVTHGPVSNNAALNIINSVKTETFANIKLV